MSTITEPARLISTEMTAEEVADFVAHLDPGFIGRDAEYCGEVLCDDTGSPLTIWQALRLAT